MCQRASLLYSAGAVSEGCKVGNKKMKVSWLQRLSCATYAAETQEPEQAGGDGPALPVAPGKAGGEG